MMTRAIREEKEGFNCIKSCKPIYPKGNIIMSTHSWKLRNIINLLIIINLTEKMGVIFTHENVKQKIDGKIFA